MRHFWLALLLTPLLLTACGEAPEPDPLRPARLTVAQEQALVPAMTLSGEVRARVESRLGFRVPGKIISRSVNAGERVTKGQELARLDPANETLQASAAKARLNSAIAERDLAKTEYQRFQDLYDRGFISTNELERRRIALDNAEAMLALARSDASQAANMVEYTVLRAGADGVIVGIAADVGEVVGAGQPVLQLAHDGPREVLVEVPEDTLDLVKHAKATVTIWAHKGVEHAASLRELSASANPMTRTFSARYTFEGDSQSALGRTASVHLSVDSGMHAVSIPSTALIKLGDGSGVWLFNEDTAEMHRVPVTLVQVTGNQLLVLGIAPGSRVASAGVHQLTDGQRVRPFESQQK